MERKPTKSEAGRAGPVVLNVDGASRGNPGPSGAGAILRSEGRILAELCRRLPDGTNNRAEYEALLMGLREADRLGARDVEVRSDSELLIRQLNGQYRVKSPGLLPLWEEAKRLAGRFERVRFHHVPREQNADADRLANEGIDGG